MPIILSTPQFFIISVATAIELLPEIGLSIASGINSLGKFTAFKIGDINFIIISKIPELLNAPIATNNPINVGNIPIVISNPSFAPSINVSKTLFFSFNPYITINKIAVGIAILDIKFIVFIIISPF